MLLTLHVGTKRDHRIVVNVAIIESCTFVRFPAMCGGNVLLGIPPAPLGTGTKEFDNQQLIFPNISFTCSGQVVKWRMAVRLNNANPRRTRFPKLQIWRPLGGGVYEKQHSTEIYINSEENNVGVYNFSVDPSLPFQSGDILGVRQPRGVPNGPPSGVDNNGSRAQARHDTAGDSVYYGTGYNENENNYVFNISGTGVTSGTGIPLVTVEIGKLFCYLTVWWYAVSLLQLNFAHHQLSYRLQAHPLTPYLWA